MSLDRAVAKMTDAGCPPMSIHVFEHYFRQLEAGHAALLGENDLVPVGDVRRLDQLPEVAWSTLDDTCVIKLNGGLGTSMGSTGPKGALPVVDGLTFLDLIARQVLHLRERHGVRLPLVFMNSFATQAGTREVLDRYPDLAVDNVPLDFLQNQVPKLRASDLAPVEVPGRPELEWCPPGHGDLLVALRTSGTLAALLEHGFRYAFVSNCDNLGAVPDPRIPELLRAAGAPFLMEVAERTPMDRKGGHLGRRALDGRLTLRDLAMVPPGGEEAFQDIEKHNLFNTNNLWIDLQALEAALAERDGVLGLPLIVNRKTADPADRSSEPVIQLETGMGTVIEALDGAMALIVGRDRFQPVKTTNELLLLRSDFYTLRDDSTLTPVREGAAPVVELDKRYFQMIAELDERFPAGAPSLRDARSLTVVGDARFGAGVVVRGDARVEVPQGEERVVADGEVLGDGQVPGDAPR